MKASLVLSLGAVATSWLKVAHGVELRSALNIKAVKRNQERGFKVKETENGKFIQNHKQGTKIQSKLAGRKKSMDWITEDFVGNGTTDLTWLQDLDACYNQSFTDCDTCTATALSNASESCIWSYEYGLCDYWLGYGDPTCDESSVTDYYWCGGCVESGGAWSSYQCLESCDDATSICYSADTSPGSSTSEICEVALNDELSCYAYELTDCESCNNVSLSDGTSCSWYYIPFASGFCDAASSLAFDFATASTTCEENGTGIIDFLLDEIDNFDLDGFIDDTGILDLFHWEGLVNDTGILDFFSGDTFYDDFDWESWDFCYNQSYTDCDTCTGTVLSDASEGCTWSDQWGSCDYLGGPASCEEYDGTDYHWCGGCFDNGGVWSGSECLESCDDATNICYSIETSQDLSTAEICDVALNDQMACWEHDFGDCESCTNTELSDGSTCSWYPGEGWCDFQMYVDGFGMFEDEFGPSTSCDEPVDISYFHWCEGCVDNGGAWVPFNSECVESCTKTDALCYSTETQADMNRTQICLSVP